MDEIRLLLGLIPGILVGLFLQSVFGKKESEYHREGAKAVLDSVKVSLIRDVDSKTISKLLAKRFFNDYLKQAYSSYVGSYGWDAEEYFVSGKTRAEIIKERKEIIKKNKITKDTEKTI